jgi:hypothetical protein
MIGMLLAACVYVAGSGGGPRAAVAQAATVTPVAARTVVTGSPAVRVAAAPHLVVTVPAVLSASWAPVAQVYGHTAAWIARRSEVALMRFDQRFVHLTLHAGWSDGGVIGWTYGDKITSREIHLLVSAFNGGFKLTYRNVGFMSGGHTAVALKPGLASVVTYTDGTSNIGRLCCFRG